MPLSLFVFICFATLTSHTVSGGPEGGTENVWVSRLEAAQRRLPLERRRNINALRVTEYKKLLDQIAAEVTAGIPDSSLVTGVQKEILSQLERLKEHFTKIIERDAAGKRDTTTVPLARIETRKVPLVKSMVNAIEAKSAPQARATGRPEDGGPDPLTKQRLKRNLSTLLQERKAWE